MSFSLDNPVFRAFLAHLSVVVSKTLFMSIATAMQRFRNKVFVNPEDTRGMKDREGGKLRPVTGCEEVERVRRCHLNDLENVIPFVLVGLGYVATNPSLSCALWHFRIFTGARLFHSIAYLLPIRQPARALGFFVGYVNTWVMIYSILSTVGYGAL